jgi:hypothetical protein
METPLDTRPLKVANKVVRGRLFQIGHGILDVAEHFVDSIF